MSRSSISLAILLSTSSSSSSWTDESPAGCFTLLLCEELAADVLTWLSGGSGFKRAFASSFCFNLWSKREIKTTKTLQGDKLCDCSVKLNRVCKDSFG